LYSWRIVQAEAQDVLGSRPCLAEYASTNAFPVGVRDAESAYLRAVSAKILGALRAKAATDDLVEGLRDINPAVRRMCLETLGLARMSHQIRAPPNTTRNAAAEYREPRGAARPTGCFLRAVFVPARS
jgi:hypothetical protein